MRALFFSFLCISIAGAALADPVWLVRGTDVRANGFEMRAPKPNWHPVGKPTFDIQLNDPKKAKYVPAVTMAELDIDIAPSIIAQVKALHPGIKLICYFSAGSWESYRDDAYAFPSNVKGNAYDGYPDERWLDVGNIGALSSIMQARIQRCRDKGFVGIDPDNVDGYSNPTGFNLTQSQLITYNRWLMNQAHTRGLAIALKNAPEIADTLNDDGFDMVVTESCFKYGFCSDYQPFLDDHKPVFAIEYKNEKMSQKKFCPQAFDMGIVGVLKRKSAKIDKYRKACADWHGKRPH